MTPLAATGHNCTLMLHGRVETSKPHPPQYPWPLNRTLFFFPLYLFAVVHARMMTVQPDKGGSVAASPLLVESSPTPGTLGQRSWRGSTWTLSARGPPSRRRAEVQLPAKPRVAKPQKAHASFCQLYVGGPGGGRFKRACLKKINQGFA